MPEMLRVDHAGEVAAGASTAVSGRAAASPAPARSLAEIADMAAQRRHLARSIDLY